MREKTMQINDRRWFFTVVALYVFFWTILPTFVRLNLPLDSLEGATWGQHLQWGYDKDPLLNAWLTRLAVELGHYRAWVIYLFSQLSVALCFWAVWQLAKKILEPRKALIAVFLLMTVQYYNIAAIDFNDNVLQLPLWALTTLYFYEALQNNKLRDWIFVGVFAGLAFLAKYYVVMLLAGMFLLLLVEKKNRQHFKSKGLYLGCAVFLLLLVPHLVWLFQHEFITLKYSAHQVGMHASWQQHFLPAFHFAFSHGISFILPAVLYFLLCVRGRASSKKDNHFSLSRFNKMFLFFIGVVPLVLTQIISMINGGELHALWGMPLVSLWGIIIVVMLGGVMTQKKLYRFVFVLAVLSLIGGGVYCYSLMRAGNTSSANYPGQDIAQYVTEQWHKKYHRPLIFVAGPRWIAGNVAFYSPDHPQVYIDANPTLNPWLDEKILREEGAVFIWEANNAPPFISGLVALPPQIFYWARSSKREVLLLKMAVLPPERK